MIPKLSYLLVFALVLGVGTFLSGSGCLREHKQERTIIKSTGSLERVVQILSAEKVRKSSSPPLTEQDYLQGLENVVPALPLDGAETLKRIDEILQK